MNPIARLLTHTHNHDIHSPSFSGWCIEASKHLNSVKLHSSQASPPGSKGSPSTLSVMRRPKHGPRRRPLVAIVVIVCLTAVNIVLWAWISSTFILPALGFYRHVAPVTPTLDRNTISSLAEGMYFLTVVQCSDGVQLKTVSRLL